MGRGGRALSASVAIAGLLSLAKAQVPRVSLDCTEPSIIITNADQLNQLKACGDVGDVTVQNITMEDFDQMEDPLLLDLPTLTKVDNLIFVNLGSDLPVGASFAISLEKLVEVQGSLNFTGLKQFNMPTLSVLEATVDISFTDVEFAQSTKPAQFGAETVPHLTQLQSLSFTRTNIETIGDGWQGDLGKLFDSSRNSLTVVDNADLTLLTMPSWNDGTVDVQVEGNMAAPNVTLPEASSCSLRLQNVGSFNAPSLTFIERPSDDSSSSNASTTKKGANTRRQTSDTTSTGGSYITNNEFTELDLGQLTTVNTDLDISDNADLRIVNLPRLETVRGEFIISGEQLTTVTFQSVDLQAGQLHIESPDAQACAPIQFDDPNFKCDALPQSTTTGDSASQSDGDGGSNGGPDDDGAGDAGTSGGSGGGLSTGAKAGIGVGVGLGVLLILIAAFLLFRRRSRRNTKPKRSMGPDAYTKEHHASSETANSPARYSKVPSEMRAEEVRRPVSSLMDGQQYQDAREGEGRGRSFSGPERRTDAVELEEQQGERFEMEEQQGMRHEMDARSLPDIDLDDESPERRSLEDIERSRNSGPVVGGGGAAGAVPQQGPVSPVG